MHTDSRTAQAPRPLIPTGLVALIATIVAVCTVPGVAQSWELRVCAEPYDYPASSRDRPGYANRVAEILADELDATLAYEWVVLDDASLERTLHAGACDAVIGIGDGVAGVESTIPFLRSPYTFVTRAADGIELTGLDDPRLANLTVGTYPGGVPTLALRRRGLGGNLREYAPLGSPDGFDRERRILDALVAGEIDVALVYGPAASARAGAEDGRLRVVPVTPEIDLGASPLAMFRLSTIGVRPHDVAFRDRLDFALASRWDEIQEAIDAYGVPRLEIVRPDATRPASPGATRIGVVVPSETAAVHPNETAGEAARRGAQLAEHSIALRTSRQGSAFDVVFASAPGDEAAVRAAERLAATEDVLALVGGFSTVQATALARIAEERDLVFFNVAAQDEGLRGDACSPATFHVAASTSMYADAALDWFVGGAPTDVYLVHERTEEGVALAEHVRVRLATVGRRLAGVSTVEPGQLAYAGEIEAIREAAPDLVLLGLEAEGTVLFYSQLERSGVDADVTALPTVQSQTREFLFRLGQAAPTAVRAPLPMPWDASLDVGEAAVLNEEFLSRSGDPMEPTAWAAYAAIMLAFEAAEVNEADDASSLHDFLLTGTESLDLGKGRGLSFRPWDHQLRQPLVLVRVRPDASWGRRASARVAIAEAVGVVPPDGEPAGRTEALDRLGTDRDRSACSF